MRNLLFIFLLSSFILSCSEGGNVKITVNVSNQKSDKIDVVVEDQKYTLSLDEAGRATKTIYISKAVYAYVYTKKSIFPVYLQPKKDLDISFDDLDRYNRVYIYCDDGGINSYLASEDNVVKSKIIKPQRYSDSDYIKKIHEVINKKREYLVSKKLPQSFVEIEKERIAYRVIEDIFYYPVYRKYFLRNVEEHSSPLYEHFIDSMFVEKPQLLQIPAYNRFIIRYVEKATNEYIKRELASVPRQFDKKDLLKSKIDYGIDSIYNKKISDHIINTFITVFINNYGIEDNKDIIELYLQNVKNPLYVDKFENLVSRFEKIKKGESAPNFTFNDRNGEPVSLKDFKGKYLLINVWSSWNYACKRELYVLNNIQKNYSKRNISFLNISVEYTEDSWKTFFKKRSIGGIHIYAGSDASFFDDYVISVVPRLILVDKEGKIIKAQTPLPSSGKLNSLLDSLKEL